MPSEFGHAKPYDYQKDTSRKIGANAKEILTQKAAPLKRGHPKTFHLLKPSTVMAQKKDGF
jgi:hypothetical protein